MLHFFVSTCRITHTQCRVPPIGNASISYRNFCLGITNVHVRITTNYSSVCIWRCCARSYGGESKQVEFLQVAVFRDMARDVLSKTLMFRNTQLEITQGGRKKPSVRLKAPIGWLRRVQKQFLNVDTARAEGKEIWWIVYPNALHVLAGPVAAFTIKILEPNQLFWMNV